MSDVFTAFSHLWPESSLASIMALIASVEYIKLPEQTGEISKIRSPAQVIVIANKLGLSDIFQLKSLGFNHFVCSGRPDFATELLASCLMVARPVSFINNPLPFFFTGFQDPQSVQGIEKNVVLEFSKSSEKSYLLDRLQLFLHQNPKLEGLADLVLQVSDELVMNALYSAPTKPSGEPLYQNTDRSTEVVFPGARKARFFASFSSYRLIVGCEDPFGSVRKHLFLDHLETVFRKLEANPNYQSAGAGLGMKFMIENSANFYFLSVPGKRTLVACGFLLQGMRANLSAAKHIHLSL